MDACRLANGWDVRAVSTPLTSENHTAKNQTGPTTDTYGVIWHTHFTIRLFQLNHPRYLAKGFTIKLKIVIYYFCFVF